MSPRWVICTLGQQVSREARYGLPEARTALPRIQARAHVGSDWGDRAPQTSHRLSAPARYPSAGRRTRTCAWLLWLGLPGIPHLQLHPHTLPLGPSNSSLPLLHQGSHTPSAVLVNWTTGVHWHNSTLKRAPGSAPNSRVPGRYQVLTGTE